MERSDAAPEHRFPFADATEVGIEPAWLKPFGPAMQAWVEAGRLVGGELLIVRRGRTVLHEARGWADREVAHPWTGGAICDIRSMTKPLLGTAALMLVHEERLALDAPVAGILPSFDTPASRAITIDQLLTHTAGFPQPGFPRPLRTYDCLREVADDLGRTGPPHPSGEQFRYSDAGSTVLGAVVEAVEGRPLDLVIRDRVLAPLGMADTGMELAADDPRLGRVPVSYRWDGATFTPYRRPGDPPRLPFLPGAGGLWSTAVDYAAFLAWWIGDLRSGTGRLLPRGLATRALAPTPLTRDADPRGSYGQHWWLYSAPHPGAPDAQLAFGHDGSDGTWALAVPALELIVVYLTQSRHGDTVAAMSGLVRRLIEG
jgi:CubicO group peptidase (beta-lactamase class C family)